jgi:hypothetical protein
MTYGLLTTSAALMMIMKLQRLQRLATLLLLLGVFLSVAHAYDFVSGGIYYNITSTTNMTASVTYFSKTNNAYSGTVTIPAFVSHGGKDYTVTAIGEYAFVGCTSLDKVEFTSDHLKTIGNYAFSGCNGMKNVVIPNHITQIGNGAFNGCYGITGVTIEEGEETLTLGCNYYDTSGKGKGLFYDCPLYSVFIGRTLSYATSNVNYYGYSPFAKITTLEKARLGNPVTSIQNYLFYGCTSLKTMVYNSQCKPTLVSIYAFYGCTSLTWDGVGLPESVKTIGSYAFQNCTKLTNLVIKPHITTINNGAFNGCTGITGVTIEEGEETLTLGYNYYDTSGKGKGLFYDCPLSSVFIGRPLSYATSNVNYYGYSPFANITTIETANLGNLVKSVQGYLFYGCKSIVDGDGIIPSSVTSIGERAFSGCAKLKTITIPNKVKSIGQYGFANCTELVRVTSLATTPPSIYANCFSENTYNNATLIVHNANAYGQAVGWKLFQNVEESGVVTEITDVQTDAPEITVFNGIIHAEGLDMKVFNMSGYLIGEGSEVPVTPGLYIVKVGGKSFKVQIKL